MKTAIAVLSVIFAGGLSCLAESAPTRHSGASLSQKLDSIIIPQIQFHDANINDVIQYLAAQGKLRDPDRKGVNIVLMDKGNKSRVYMSVRNISLRKALISLATMADLSLEIEEGRTSVMLKPKEKK